MPVYDHYAVAVKKQLDSFYEECHSLILYFSEEEALLQSYKPDDILQTYHRVGLKFCVTANIAFSAWKFQGNQKVLQLLVYDCMKVMLSYCTL